MSRPGRRPAGFTFVEVLLATVVFAVGAIATVRLLAGLAEQLAPLGPSAGLRRGFAAEELLRAQAEGLRALRHVSPVPASNLVVRPDPATGYAVDLRLTRAPVLRRHGGDGRAAALQLDYADIVVTHRGQALGALSLSTLRSRVVGQDEKIGL